MNQKVSRVNRISTIPFVVVPMVNESGRRGRGFCGCAGCRSDIVVEPIPCVRSDGDEMDWSAGLGDGLPGGGCKKCLSGQSASSLLFVRDEIFFVQNRRL